MVVCVEGRGADVISSVHLLRAAWVGEHMPLAGRGFNLPTTRRKVTDRPGVIVPPGC